MLIPLSLFFGARCRKTLEVVGLRLTPVQHVYWKAVQRRMVLGQLKGLVETEEGIDGEANGLPPIPRKLLLALTESDKGRERERERKRERAMRLRVEGYKECPA